LAQLTASSITGQKLSFCHGVCVCVNQGGTNHNRYTRTLVILHGDPVFPPWDVSPKLN